jgi:hypothetical protein
VIYSMLDTKPLELTEIRDRFVAKATQCGLPELGLDRIGDISIHAALLDLLANKVVVRLPPIPPLTADRYAASRLSRVDPSRGIKDAEARALARAKSVNDVSTIIEHHNGQFTEYDLAQFIRTSTQLGDEVVTHLPSITGGLEARNQVGRDPDGELHRLKNILVVSPPPPPAAPPLEYR